MVFLRNRLIAFFYLSRPHFLVFTTLPYAVGVLVAWRAGSTLDLRLALGGLLIQWLIQLCTAYFNDYWDIPTDRLNTRRTWLSGGSGKLADGALPARTGLIAGIVCVMLAVLVGMVLAIPPVAWLVGGLGVLAAVSYTAPPLRLAWRGLGELAAALTAAWLVPLWGYALLAGELGGDVLRLGLPLIPFIASMLHGIATPDLPADAQVGKRTLAVMLGPARVPLVYAALVGLGDVLAVWLWGDVGLLAALLSLPVALLAWRGLRGHADKSGWALLWMVACTGLPPLVALLVLLASLLPSQA